MNLIRIGLLTGLLLLGSCGFQLRGTEHPLDVRFPNMRLATSGSDEAFYLAVKQSIRDAGIKLNDNSENILEVISSKEDKRTASYSSRAKSAEFELIKIVIFRFTREDSELIKPMSLEARRSYLYRETAAVGKAEEEVLLKQEMNKDLAQRILLSLQRAANAMAVEAVENTETVETTE